MFLPYNKICPHFIPNLVDPGVLEQAEVAQSAQMKGKVQGPAHGDELAYLFEPLNEEGQPLDTGEMSSTDARVRDNFVSLIAKFAHGATEPEKKQTTGGGLLGLPLSPFSKKDEHDQFLKITDSVTVEKDFRFCQMGIWGNIGDRLTGALCKNLVTDLLTKIVPLDNVLGGVQKGNIMDVPIVGGVLGNSGNSGGAQNNQMGLGGLLNGNSGAAPNNQMGNRGQTGYTGNSAAAMNNQGLGGLGLGGLLGNQGMAQQPRRTTPKNRFPFDF